MNAWLQLIGSGAIGALVLAIVNGAFTRRKLSAEATQIITDAAGNMVARLEDQLEDLAGKLHATEAARDQDRRHMRAIDERLVVHAAWDRGAVIEAERQGFHLPPPPPLFSEDVAGRTA